MPQLRKLRAGCSALAPGAPDGGSITQLVFLWQATKVAVVVELDRDEDEPDDLEQAMIRGVPPTDWPLGG